MMYHHASLGIASAKPLTAGAAFCATAIVTAETQPTTLGTYIALVSAIIGLATVLLGLWHLTRKVQEVHVLVNNNLSMVMRKLGIEEERTTVLTDALKDADIIVPERKVEQSDVT